MFTARIVQRVFTRYESGDQGIIAHGPLGAAIAWNDLNGLKLKFFSTRRDRRDGWMMLILKDGKHTLKLESTLTGFDEIVDRAAEIAKAKRLALTDATTNNLLAMGAPVIDDRAEDTPDASALSGAGPAGDGGRSAGKDRP